MEMSTAEGESPVHPKITIVVQECTYNESGSLGMLL